LPDLVLRPERTEGLDLADRGGWQRAKGLYEDTPGRQSASILADNGAIRFYFKRTEAALVEENTLETLAIVIGGGIAGCWAALKLAERGVTTTLVTYSGTDRGGLQGATGRSLGAINTSLLEQADF